LPQAMHRPYSFRCKACQRLASDEIACCHTYRMAPVHDLCADEATPPVEILNPFLDVPDLWNMAHIAAPSPTIVQRKCLLPFWERPLGQTLTHHEDPSTDLYAEKDADPGKCRFSRGGEVIRHQSGAAGVVELISYDNKPLSLEVTNIHTLVPQRFRIDKNTYVCLWTPLDGGEFGDVLTWAAIPRPQWPVLKIFPQENRSRGNGRDTI